MNASLLLFEAVLTLDKREAFVTRGNVNFTEVCSWCMVGFSKRESTRKSGTEPIQQDVRVYCAAKQD